MSIPFYPKIGQILWCDLSDFKAPEMTKRRPVIIIGPKLNNRSDLVTIVPLSLSLPNEEVPYVVKLSKNYHPKEEDGDEEKASWAKCDMVMNLSKSRLEGFCNKQRGWYRCIASNEDLNAVRKGVLYGLDFFDLIKWI